MLKHCDVCDICRKKQNLFRFGVLQNKLSDYTVAAIPVLFAVESGNDTIGDARCGLSVEAENAVAIAAGVVKFFLRSSDERGILDENGR